MAASSSENPEQISYRLQTDAAKKRLMARIHASGIPPRFLDASLENYRTEGKQQEIVHQAVSAYLASFKHSHLLGTSLILFGTTGTGKTHLACAILQAVMRMGYTGGYRRVSQAIRSFRLSWTDRTAKSESDVLDEFAGLDLLVLDEVGKQYGTPAEQQCLFEILDERYLAMKPTILISNEDLAGIERYIGTYAMDRLRERGGKALVCDWPSIRGSL